MSLITREGDGLSTGLVIKLCWGPLSSRVSDPVARRVCMRTARKNLQGQIFGPGILREDKDKRHMKVTD